MLSIDWTRGELRPAPRKDRPNKQETFYPVECDCGKQYWLRKGDIQRSDRCNSCAGRERGAKGWAMTVAKLGKRGAFEKMRGALLNGVTPWSEKIVMGWLDNAGIYYERQHILEADDNTFFLVDFRVGDLLIEVNGWGHCLPQRAARDSALKQAWGGALLIISTKELSNNPTQCRAELIGQIRKDYECIDNYEKMY